MSNSKSRYRRRRRALFAAIREELSQRRWDAMGGIQGWLRLRYPDPLPDWLRR